MTALLPTLHPDLCLHRNDVKVVRRKAASGAVCLGVDLSHWQGSINFVALKTAGFVFVVLKATEGNGYIDPNFKTYRAQAHAAGLIVLMYHYVGSSSAKTVYDATSEVNHFIAAVGTLAAGEGIALDYEPANPPANPPAWCRSWLDRAKAVLGASPWIYMNSSTEARYDWSALVQDYGLWLAKYDNDTDMDPVVHWPSLAAEQYWDKATVPGVSGPVDADVFYGSASQLLLYCKQGGTPAQEGLFMALSDAEQTELRDDIRYIKDQIHGGNPAYSNIESLFWMLKGGNEDFNAQIGYTNLNWVADSAVKAVADATAQIIAKVAETQGVTLDEEKLAAAFAADPAALKALGQAFAESVQLAPRQAAPASA